MRQRSLFAAALLLGTMVAACSGQPQIPPASQANVQANVRRAIASSSVTTPLVWMVKESGETAPILEAAVQSGDYISTLIARAQPDLVTRVGGWTHVYGTANSSATGASPPPASMQYALARCPTAQIQLYDGEHWPITPEDEQDDPAGAILSGAAQARSTAPCGAGGFSSYHSGTSPDGIFEGWDSCTYDNQSTGAFYNELANGISLHDPIGGTSWTPSDWSTLDYYNTQGQTLLSQSPWDLCYGSISFWLSAVQNRFVAARAGNPAIVLWTEYSFGDETENMIVQAIKAAQTAAIPPQADVIEYPITPTPRPECPDPYISPTPPPHSFTTRCTFAVPSRLRHLMQFLGRPTPTPTP